MKRQETINQKQQILRWCFYLAGLLVLALGITINTKAGLGVSPIISVSYSISTIWKLNFGNTTLVLYGAFVVVELILHLLKKPPHLKRVLVLDVLQFPLSLVFTRFLNLFSAWIPNFKVDFAGTVLASLPVRIVVLVVAIILTGVGAAMSLNMRIIPNPGDGIVQAISDVVGKPVGLTKNCFDLFNICVTTTVGLVFAGHIVGIGLGTVLAVIGVGRVMAIFNKLCMNKMLAVTGME
jgi:uncharacterized membrane protein YczE